MAIIREILMSGIRACGRARHILPGVASAIGMAPKCSRHNCLTPPSCLFFVSAPRHKFPTLSERCISSDRVHGVVCMTTASAPSICPATVLRQYQISLAVTNVITFLVVAVIGASRGVIMTRRGANRDARSSRGRPRASGSRRPVMGQGGPVATAEKVTAGAGDWTKGSTGASPMMKPKSGGWRLVSDETSPRTGFRLGN